MKFKDFILKEVGTSTSCIAGFPRMTIPLVRRVWPPELGGEWPEDSDKKKGKKKVYKQPQVED